MLISGGCHCGNIGFTLRWVGEPVAIPARACACTFCTKHGGVWTSCPGGTLEISERDPKLVSRYAFGTETAEFHVCARCGVVPLVTSLIDGQLFAVVSVNALQDVDPALIQRAAAPADFDGEIEHERLARRRRNWIAQVSYSD